MKRVKRQSPLIEIEKDKLIYACGDIDEARYYLAEAIKKLTKLVDEIDIPITSPFIDVVMDLRSCESELDMAYQRIDV